MVLTFRDWVTFRGLPTIDSFGNDELKQIIMGLPDELVEIGIELIY
jgi:hypothetical protein